MKILIVVLGRIGDMILTTPLFSAIKTKYPESEIDVLASVPNHAVLKSNPNINKIFVLDKSPLKLLRLFYDIRKNEYDWLMDPKDHYSRESNVIAKFIKAKNKVGYMGLPNSNFDKSIILDDHKNIKHLSGRYMQCLTFLDIHTTDTVRPVLFTDIDSENKVLTYFEKAQGKKLIVFNISAGSTDRLWSKENWIDVINQTDSQSFMPVLTYMKQDSLDAESISRKTGIDVFISSSFLDIIALIKHSALVVTPDTSFVHVASAFNIPVLALYSGLQNNIERFAPLSDIAELAISEEGDKTVNTILPEEVITKYNSLQIIIKNP